MNEKDLATLLQQNYSFETIADLEFLRDGGSRSYSFYGDGRKYFLRAARAEIIPTIEQSLSIHLFLQSNGYAVPKLMLTNGNPPFVSVGAEMYIVYEFIEGKEPDVDECAERVGELVGQLHALMADYEGHLTVQDKAFYIDRYIAILRKKGYPEEKVAKYQAHGDALWARVRDLPRSHCHGDLYSGNVWQGASGALYMLDLDTSCIGFPGYDIALYCRATDYFAFNEDGYAITHARAKRFVEGYRKHRPISEAEVQRIDDLLAIYHYQLQATIIEIYGMDCVDFDFFDAQYEWLMKWAAQSAAGEAKDF